MLEEGCPVHCAIFRPTWCVVNRFFKSASMKILSSPYKLKHRKWHRAFRRSETRATRSIWCRYYGNWQVVEVTKTKQHLPWRNFLIHWKIPLSLIHVQEKLIFIAVAEILLRRKFLITYDTLEKMVKMSLMTVILIFKNAYVFLRTPDNFHDVLPSAMMLAHFNNVH